MTKSRAEEVFDHTIRRVTLFSTTLGPPWAIFPDGPLQAWPVYSRRFREWIAYSFFTKHLLYPGRHSLESAITVLAAYAHHGGAPKGEIFTRLGHTGNPHRPDSVLLHVANGTNELLESTKIGYGIIPAPQPPDPRLPSPDSHSLPPPPPPPPPFPVPNRATVADQLESL